ncbi:MAG: ATP-binding protein [Oscillospiraceae bacterium]|nr:ATP-binding protein [Oscillospiraceae bacterium]
MLVQFSVTNYRSLKDKVTVSLLAGADKEHASDLIQADGKKQLVPTAAIYGANASGKSNVLMALKTMQDMITGTSAQLLKEKKLPYDPFAFEVMPKEHRPTRFEIIYYYKGIKYAYGFSYDSKQILTEMLHHWPNGREALIFSRENDKFEFRENVNEQTTLAGRTPANRLYLVSSNEWNSPQTELAYKWFAEKLLPYDEHETPDATMTIFAETSNDPIRSRVLSELLLADLGIVDVQYETEHKSGASRNIRIYHKLEHFGNDAGFTSLPLEQESKGTQRFFARIGPWIEALEKGGILFVDEIESSMHPLLTRRLVEMIQDPNINTKHAQLIFTTHDVMLLDLTLLRRDQIWFADKDPKTLATELFSLWDFSARKGENIRKGYLQGRFGAIPFIGWSESSIPARPCNPGGDTKWHE